MLESRTVLITGATGALGSAVARAVARTEASLVLTSRAKSSLDQLAAALDLPRERLLVHAADLTVPADVSELVAAAEERFGGVDVLLNCAGGWFGGKPLGDVSDEDWQRALDVNLTTAFYICRAVLPRMIERGWGRIVNVSSKAAETPMSRQVGYNVAKAGVVALTQSIAAEARRDGVAANVLLPSIIDTPANREGMSTTHADRWVSPADIADAMLFLCSDAGASLNGAAIPVHGQV